MPSRLSLLLVLMFLFGFSHCTDPPTSHQHTSDTDSLIVTDIDGNVYPIVPIGDQWWMAKNLRVMRYRNGDSIAHVPDSVAWSRLTTGAWESYDNLPYTIDRYGLLYNWYAVADTRQIAPAGWHIPSDAEWQELERTLGMAPDEVAGYGNRGTDEGGKLKLNDPLMWHSPNSGATNSSGFSAIPGGLRVGIGDFVALSYHGVYWTGTAADSTHAFYRLLVYNDATIWRRAEYKQYGFSVRCVKDAEN